ncbi:MAG: 6-bladed beta-propeller [Bacillota bacterium]
MEESRLSRSRKRKRMITVKQLLQIILAIVILLSALFGYLYWRSAKPEVTSVFSMDQPPKYLFSIYGNEKKPLKSPMAVYVSSKDLIYVASTNNHEIQVFKPNGKYLFSFGQSGSNPGEMAYPYGITENEKGNLLIAETGNKRIQEYTPDGKFIRIITGSNSQIKVEKPGPLLSRNGKLYIGDLVKHEVIIVNEKGKTEQVIRGVSYPHGVDADKNGRIYIADAGGYRIAIFSKGGRELKSIAAWQGENRFGLLRGLALDRVGRIFAVDSIMSTIRVFDPDGKYLFSFGSKGFDKGEFLYPAGIFIDDTSRIFIADWANNRVEVWGY